MNPLLKFIIKQIEENACVVESQISRSEWAWSRVENKVEAAETFNQLHAALKVVKTIVEEIL